MKTANHYLTFFGDFLTDLFLIGAGHVLFLYTPWAFPLSLILIGRGLLGLGVLGHDLAHGNIFSSPRLNEIFATFCFNITTKSKSRYWEMHRGHHLHINTDKDPHHKEYAEDYHFRRVKTKLDFIISLAKYSLDFRHFIRVEMKRNGKRKTDNPPFWDQPILYNVAIWTSIFLLLGAWSLVLHLMALLFFVRIVDTLRVWGEHGVKGDGVYDNTRDYDAGAFFNFLLRPHNINFHIHHHHVASTPYYLLNRSEYRQHDSRYHLVDGYIFGKNTVLNVQNSTQREHNHE